MQNTNDHLAAPQTDSRQGSMPSQAARGQLERVVRSVSEAHGLAFVNRSYGQYTTGTVGFDTLTDISEEVAAALIAENARLRKILAGLIALPVGAEAIRLLLLGIGTKTDQSVWLDARAALEQQ
jgi:hypothetical protein